MDVSPHGIGRGSKNNECGAVRGRARFLCQYDHAFNRTISSFIGEALMIDMALAQQTDLLRNRVLSLKPPVRFEGRAKTARTKHRSPIFRQFR